MKLTAQELFFSYPEKTVISNCSLSLEQGKLTVITGPNGSGKTTLLHLLGGLLKPQKGNIFLNERELGSFSHIERACSMAVLTQNKPPALDFTVAERIMMGRFANLARLSAPGKEDEDEVETAMELMGVKKFAEMPCNHLSGGEYQKVLIAALLARRTPVMLLDEPTSALDPAGARCTLEILAEKKKEAAVAVITHDLALAGAFADELILLGEGEIRAEGAPDRVLTEENLRQVYHCDSEILKSSDNSSVVVFK